MTTTYVKTDYVVSAYVCFDEDVDGYFARGRGAFQRLFVEHNFDHTSSDVIIALETLQELGAARFLRAMFSICDKHASFGRVTLQLRVKTYSNAQLHVFRFTRADLPVIPQKMSAVLHAELEQDSPVSIK